MHRLQPHIRLLALRLIAKVIDFGLVWYLHGLTNHVFWTLFGILYLLAADGFFQGQSLGKRIVGLRVQHITGADKTCVACPYSQSAIRNLPFALMLFLSTVPILGKLFVLLGLIFIAVEIYFMYSDDEGIRIGDIYAKTRVCQQP